MVDKRIVFQHMAPPYLGIYQIMGMTSELGGGEVLPPHAEGFEAMDRIIEFASLVEVKSRYALYREVVMPEEAV